VTDTFEPPVVATPVRTTSRGGVPTYSVCRVAIADLDTLAAAERIVDAAITGTSLQVHLCNAYTLSIVDRDARLREALLASDMNLPDGTPVAWIGRSPNRSGPVRGPGLVGAVATAGLGVARHYLWGGKEGVADGMADRLRQVVPGVDIVGTDSPPFRIPTDEDLFDLAGRVRASGANILWIGLGTPRQDYVVHRLAPLLDMPIVPVGAAFDFWSGAVPEAPAFLHGSGFEWVYRLAREPRRLWRRYLIGNPRFLVAAWRHRSA
jgi:N-acetylglucosaminyldiphosphoundecaprenol N-acetyl-beta-D-mannosaminyltransferase